MQNTKLEDRFEAHYKNDHTKGGWYRMMCAPKKTVAECMEWVNGYNRSQNIAGLVHIPMEKGLSTEFRIVKLERTIVNSFVRQD